MLQTLLGVQPPSAMSMLYARDAKRREIKVISVAIERHAVAEERVVALQTLHTGTSLRANRRRVYYVGRTRTRSFNDKYGYNAIKVDATIQQRTE